jgi:hypothetical protein
MKKITILLCALADFAVISSVPVAAQGVFPSPYASVPVLLNIDLSDPAAVLITSTGQFSTNNNNSTTAYDGVLLAGFFSSGVLTNGVATGSLTGGDSGVAYDAFASDTIAGVPAPLVNLDLYNSGTGTGGIQTFAIGSSAFSGSAILDFSSIASFLNGRGATGNIYAGNGGANGTSGNLGPIIGQWIIIASVPEPGSNALLAFGALAASLLIYRRYRQPAA